VVVATIKPLALIARDVLGPAAEVRQLLPDNASPHGYALRISERRLLTQADLVLWVGPGLESFLVDALRSVAPGRQIMAAELPGMHWPAAAADLGHGHGHGDGHPEAHDQHLWLDPRNAAAMARALVTSLVDAGRVDAGMIAAADAFAARLRVLEAELDAALEPVRDRPFAGDHDAFGHFVARFHLTPAGYLRDVAGHAAGARSRAALLGRDDVRCLVAEPDSRLTHMRHLAGQWQARLVVIDVLGTDMGNGGSYELLLRSIAESFGACLGGGPPGNGNR
jgi:zinc transport system substrate-binding protein